MARLSYNELKIGTIFVKDNAPYKVVESAFIRMQQRKPVMQLKIINLVSGKTQEYAAHQNEEFTEAEIEVMPVQFIYENRGEYWFNEKTNPKNRFQLSKDILGEAARFLKPNTELTAYQFDGKFINAELPIKMDLTVTEAPPAVKGNTAQGGTKLVTLETGAKVDVPLFVEEGDTVRVNTQTGDYIERVQG